MTLDTSTSTKDLMSIYMEYVTQLRGDLSSVEDFSTYAKIEEEHFYTHFSNLLAIEQDIWSFILKDAIDTIVQDPQYNTFGQDEQLLSFFYTFFESLTLNNEYFLAHLSIRNSFNEKREVAKGMKALFNNYIDGTIGSNPISGLGIDQVDFVNDIVQRGQKEGFWIQLLFLIDFWSKDQSERKEKTDIAIEKSVRAAIDLIEIAPVKSIFDLGRFIWQEKRNSN